MSSILAEAPLKPNIVHQPNNQNFNEEYINENSIKRKIEFDRGNPLSFNFCSNKVRTIPYTFSGFSMFLWKKLLNSPFNIILLLIILFYLLTFFSSLQEVSHLGLGNSFTFNIVIIIIELILTIYEYMIIFSSDYQRNSQPAKIYCFESKKFLDKTWGDIRVGQIIRVNKGEVVPADLIILEAMDHNHQCYVDSSSVDGIFDSFGLKRACSDTHAPSMKSIKFNEYIKNIKGSLKYEEPNSNMHQFNGRLKLESFPRASEITEENFVMRGSTIKNTKWIYGLAVYTGMETKIMQTLKISDNELHSKSIIKRDRDIIRVTLKFIQFFLIALYLVLILLMLFIDLHKAFLNYYSFLSPRGDDHTYLEFYSIYNPNPIADLNKNDSPFFELYLSIIHYVLTFHFMLPYNWFGIIRIAYMILSKFIQWDAKVLLNGKNQVEIINQNCIADFGQIRHILTDKTGTLTSRKFSLRVCSIKGKLYSFDCKNKRDENYVFRVKENNLSSLEIYQELRGNSLYSAHIKEFVLYLCLCHTVKVIGNIKRDKEDKFNNDKIYGSCFAEERSTLKMMGKLGYTVKKTKGNIRYVEINNQMNSYTTIGVNKYSEERKRMSILIKLNPDEDTSVLLCKANDCSIFSLCKKTSNDNELIKTKMQIREMMTYGYRFFIYCKKNLDEEETNTFISKYKCAENYVVKSEEHLMNLAIEYEKDFELLGVLFFEEKIPNDLKYSIAKLTNNNIKVWIASGDKKENVLAVGKNLNIYNTNAIRGDFSDKDKPEDLDSKMSMLLMQLLFPNEKINKMKTRKGVSVEAQSVKGSSKDLTILMSGNCFTKICTDPRNFQSLATLLSYCTHLLGYSFTPNNKYLLCQMIKRYVSKNSKVLAIGDGFNDFMMLKEADLSIGIRSREILQVRNSCDIIVNEFPQIVDLILVHGTWDFNKLMSIASISFYLNVFIVFPMFLHQNSNLLGSTFYVYSALKLSLDVLILNLSVIFLVCFDYPIERSIIGLNANVYKENFYDQKKLVFEFGFEFIKAAADSLILYYLHFIFTGVNKTGETIDQQIFGSSVLYTTYVIILLKIFTMKLKAINFLHIVTLFITCVFLTGISFIDVDLRISLAQGMSYINVVCNAFLIIAICFLYEYTAFSIINIISSNFILQVTTLFKQIVNTNMLFRNVQSMYISLSKDSPKIINKIDKITYPEVLEKIHQKNVLDPALESMADVANEEVALLKIKKPFLRFYDEKLEEDYINFRSTNSQVFVSYLFSLFSIWLVDAIIEGFPTDQLITKIIKICYILLGLILLIRPLNNHKQMPIIHYFGVITLEIICLYIEKSDNDMKILFQPFFILCIPLIFPIYNFSLIFLGAFYYLLGILPSIYINDFNFTIIKNQEFFLYSNLPLIYHRSIFVLAIIILLMFVSYHGEIASRIEFLKFQKCEAELKKDNLIMKNLVPDFVRERISEEHNAVLSYEIVTILFCDIMDFDSIVAKLSPPDIISFLDELYNLFDQFCFLHGLQKIETVGKTYMAAGGLHECEVDYDPKVLLDNHAVRCFEFGIDILDVIQKIILTSGEKVKVKIGIHTGKVIPAIVGHHKPQFSLIGDTVNTTARMCSYSNDNCINCSEFSYEELKHKYKDFTVSSRDVKGKGMMNLYLFNPLKNKKIIEVKTKIPKESSANLLFKSLTKNVYNRQTTKTSKKGAPLGNFGNSPSPNIMNSNNNNNNHKNDSNHTSKRNSFIENSNLIIESSIDNILDNNNPNQTLPHTNSRNRNKNNDLNNNEKRKENEEVAKKNDYLSNSFLFLAFKNSTYKNGFMRYEKQKFLLSEDLSIKVNVCFILNILFGIYQFSQYALISTTPIALFIVIKAILMIILIGIVYQTKFVIQNSGEVLRWLNFAIFLGFTITTQLQMNFCDDEFQSNIAMEEMLMIMTITLNGMLSYQQICINTLVYIILFIINACVNYNSYLVVKYCVFLITETIVIQITMFMKYYYTTLDFLENHKKARILSDTEKHLFNQMPLHVVQQMKDDIKVADILLNVTMLFADIVRFTDFSACHEPVEVVKMLCELFKGFDDSTKECSVYKVHTIGDCYVVMGFNGKVSMNERNYYEEAKNVCKMAENMIKIIRQVRKAVNFEQLDMRIGIHTGSVIAGIIGSSVVRYDIFGSDVLIANKMESSGMPGKINLSEDTKNLLETKDMPFTLSFNNNVHIPSVGKEMKCFFIDTPQFD